MTKPLATFQSLLATADLPSPGPDYFAARRALWITPTAASRLDQTTSASLIKRDGPLENPGASESAEVWEDRLLPLRAVIKIVHAGWRRDGTWPDNAIVVDEDNFFGSHAIDPSVNAASSLATSEGGQE
ncbi:hypothetical protein EDB84DRAFT_1454218 [Lactarius hengduanensis]|nr:hypothetical protein EDB84DRAFT_1454218 [Lactarius hengduanensis]